MANRWNSVAGYGVTLILGFVVGWVIPKQGDSPAHPPPVGKSGSREVSTKTESVPPPGQGGSLIGAKGSKPENAAGLRAPFLPSLDPRDFDRVNELAGRLSEVLKSDEMDRLKPVDVTDSEEGSSITMTITRPSEEERSEILDRFLTRLSSGDRAFVSSPGMQRFLERKVNGFYNYRGNCRYIIFSMPKDSSLPTAIIFETDEAYDLAQDEWMIQASDVDIREFEALKLGSENLQRYGNLFGLE